MFEAISNAIEGEALANCIEESPDAIICRNFPFRFMKKIESDRELGKMIEDTDRAVLEIPNHFRNWVNMNPNFYGSLRN